MRIIAPMILVTALLLQYTTPSGHPLFINQDQIVSIGEPITCADKAGARIMTGNQFLCVRETVDEAVAKFLMERAK